MSRKYGINVISLWPWVIGENGIDVAVRMASAANFDGLQVLPLRGWTHEKLVEYSYPVISQEKSFNNGNIFECFVNTSKSVLGITNAEGAPRMVDWVLFGKNRELENLGGDVLYCVHDDNEAGDVYEISPKKSKEFKNSLNGDLLFNRDLCIDTRHIRGFDRRSDREIKAKNTLELLRKIPSDLIKLIHINPIKTSSLDEEELLFLGKDCELIEMLKILGKKSNAPVILELVPKINLSEGGRVSYLNLLRKAVFQYLG